jgi:uncharacterized protein (TIGR03083 family)
MEKAEVWRHIHAERAALAATLADLPTDDWSRPSLCTGWTVHDVAVHVISTPQIGWSDITAMTVRNLGRSYNRMVFREVKRLSARETRETILADFERYADSTHRVPITTSIEPLLDALLHHQDIVRPLGLTHPMPPDAAAVAADRVRRLSFLLGTRRLVRSVRMVADDVDWTRGSGPTISGPMQELLMICSGREPDRTLVTGDGLVEVR